MKFLTCFLCCFLISISVRANDDRFLPIEEIKTDNGITAWLVTDNTLPILAINFAFEGAGAKNNTNDKQGVAKLLSNMLDEGAGNIKSQEFQKQLSDHSISLSFAASRDNFSGKLKTLSKNQNKAFELLALALKEPRFDSEPLERMRQSNLTRLKSSIGDPQWIAQRIYNDVAYADHPYALNSGGTISTLENITAEDLRAFKHQYLTKDRLIIGVAGNITGEELRPLLDKTFADLPTAQNKKAINKITLQNTGSIFVHEKDIPQSIIIQSNNSIDPKSAEYPALQVMNYIFGGGGFGSRLMTEAREKRGLTYGIYSSLTNLDEINSFDISTSTDNANTDQMLNIIAQEKKNMIASVTEQEVKNAQSYLTGSLPLSLTSTSGIADILTSLQLNNRPIDYLDQYVTRIKNVRASDVKAMAQTIFSDDNNITVIVGKPEHIENFKPITELPNVE